MSKTPSNYPEILQDFKRIICEVLRDKVDNAEQLAHEVAEIVRREWGGNLVYICKGTQYQLSQRDLQIWNDFTGDNHQALSKKYQVSLPWIYKIITHQRREQLKKRQGDLFPEDDG